MKYKRGSIVEVMTKDEVPYHSWRCAQIISGNDHNYTVRYDIHSGFAKQGNIEYVSTKFIRPCPPSLEISECIPGDVVEVFHNLSWKMAVVSKVISRDMYLVRLVGSFLEFEASKSELRVRQSWQNNEWIVIGKVHIKSEDARCNSLFKRSSSSGSKEKQRDFKRKSFQSGAQNDNLQESHIVSTRTLKRGSPYYFSQDDVNEGTSLKFRITQKEGKRLRVLITSPEKVSKKGIYTYFDNRKSDDDEHSVTCSVGSCSINSYSDYDIRSHDSDAESFSQCEYQEDTSLCSKELAAEIHRLELQAYRRTIEALHASGPLTWEKETMAQSWRLVHLAYESVS